MKYCREYERISWWIHYIPSCLLVGECILAPPLSLVTTWGTLLRNGPFILLGQLARVNFIEIYAAFTKLSYNTLVAPSDQLQLTGALMQQRSSRLTGWRGQIRDQLSRSLPSQLPKPSTGSNTQATTQPTIQPSIDSTILSQLMSQLLSQLLSRLPI